MQVDKTQNSSEAQRKHDEEEIPTAGCFFHIRLVLDGLKDPIEFINRELLVNKTLCTLRS